MITRPDVNEFVRLVEDLANLQDDLNKVEYEYKKLVANCKRTAMNSGAKTREVDIVEYLGNNSEDEKRLDNLMQSMFDRKKAIRILWGKVEAWKAAKDIYRSDSYHIVGGRGFLGEPDKENFFGGDEKEHD